MCLHTSNQPGWPTASPRDPLRVLTGEVVLKVRAMTSPRQPQTRQQAGQRYEAQSSGVGARRDGCEEPLRGGRIAAVTQLRTSPPVSVPVIKSRVSIMFRQLNLTGSRISSIKAFPHMRWTEPKVGAPFLEAIPPNAVVFTATLPPALLDIENQMSDNRISDRISDLRDLRNSITLAQLPAVAPLLTRYRLFKLQFRFLSTKDDV